MCGMQPRHTHPTAPVRGLTRLVRPATASVLALLALLTGLTLAKPGPALAAATAGRPLAATSIAAGDSHTCGILTTGAVHCWGGGYYGQLGYGTNHNVGDHETPASAGDVPLGGSAVAIAAGREHTCAVTSTGAVRCWGYGYYGQLGYGNTTTIGDDETPASAGNVPLSATAVAITAGWYHTCALLSTGDVRCWGYGYYGQLGYGNLHSIGDDETPASNVPLGAKAAAITAGSNHTCALLTTGDVRCWGHDSYGQLGYGNTHNIGDDETPASAGNIPLGAKATAIAAGGDHTCALLTTRDVRCWGDGSYGQLGYGNTNSIGDTETPASAGNVPLGAKAVAVAAGGSHTCAVLTTGTVKCWGENSTGQLGYAHTRRIGDDETPASAGDVPLGGTALAVTAGDSHTCAVLTTGDLRCWGFGGNGRLGYGNTDNVGDNETPASVGSIVLGGAIRTTAPTENHTQPPAEPAPSRLTARAHPHRDHRAPYHWRITGALTPMIAPGKVGCSGMVITHLRYRRHLVATRKAQLRSACTYRLDIRVSATRLRRALPSRLRRGHRPVTLTLTLTWPGDRHRAPASKHITLRAR